MDTLSYTKNRGVERKKTHGKPYYLTQFVIRHGCFRANRHGFKLEDRPDCPVCLDSMEDAEHVFCDCTRYQQERDELKCYLQIRITSESIMIAMQTSEDRWGAVSNYAADLLKKERGRKKKKKKKRVSKTIATNDECRDDDRIR